MSTSSSSSSLSKSLRPGKSSIHSELISEMTPGWLIDAVPARRTAIKETGTQPPNWYLGASSNNNGRWRRAINEVLPRRLCWTRRCRRYKTSTPLPNPY